MRKKNIGSRRAFGSRAKRPAMVDPDDAPGVTDEMLDRAEIVKEGKVIQRGRSAINRKAR